MATSGSSNFNVTRNELIRDAALDLGAIAAGVTMGSQMLTDFARTLNGIVKAWAADGIKVWTVSEATLFPAVDTVKYLLAGTSAATAHVTGTYYETSLSAAEASSQTTLSVTSSANMTVSDNIGIVLDDGTLHWTTISSIPDSTSVTIASAITDTAASGNAVFNYTSKIGRPLRIVDARVYNIDDATDTPIEIISRQEYNALPRKTSSGNISQIFYDRQLTNGFLYLWQPLDAITDLIKFTYHRTIEDFDSAGDNPDLPQEFYLALRFALAEAMSATYPCSEARMLRIATNAEKYLWAVKGSGEDQESIFVQPDDEGGGYFGNSW
jgi:hypothetical protein